MRRRKLLGFATAALLLAVAAPSCTGDTCRSNADCGNLFCQSPEPGPSCGIPPRTACAASSDCPTGEVCHAVDDPCSASGFGSACGPPCDAGHGACEAGLRCNVQGACEPITCDQGVACPPYQVCNPPADAGPVYDESNGCQAVTCQGDAACPRSTVCVNGVCASGPGHCVAPQAVP